MPAGINDSRRGGSEVHQLAALIGVSAAAARYERCVSEQELSTSVAASSRHCPVDRSS